MLAAVALRKYATDETKITACAARTTLPPNNQIHAGPGIFDSGPGNIGTVPHEKSATKASTVGGKRPMPQGAAHCCTRTSNSANDAAEPPAARIVSVTWW